MRLLLLLAVYTLLLVGCASRNGPGALQPERSHGIAAGTFVLVDDAIDRVVRRGRIPGGVVLLCHRGLPVYTRAFGRASPDRSSRAITPAMSFDVASLTKTLAAAPVGWRLLGDDPAEAERQQVRRLLHHTSGLRDDDVFEESLVHVVRGGTALPQLQNMPAAPGCYRYANANTVLLGGMGAERLGDLGEFLREEVWEPLGLQGVTWRPPPGITAASGVDPEGGYLYGRPFDRGADFLLRRHGVTPIHSGLFATADEVARFADGLLYPSPDAPDWAGKLREFLFGRTTAYRLCGSRVGIHLSDGGMASPVGMPLAPEGSTPGRVYVQTGYTGCLLWVNRERELTLVILTNAAATGALDDWRGFHREVVAIINRGRP